MSVNNPHAICVWPGFCLISIKVCSVLFCSIIPHGTVLGSVPSLSRRNNLIILCKQDILSRANEILCFPNDIISCSDEILSCRNKLIMLCRQDIMLL